MQQLVGYPWPGNIRELRHAVERAVIMCDDQKLTREDFLLKTHRTFQTSPPPMQTVNINEMEKATIEAALQKHNGNLSKSASELGMSRSTLYRKMEKYDIAAHKG
jgi:transcriptional regulator of acetoin/glycerol metabolism